MGVIVLISNYLVQFPINKFGLENILTYGAFSYPIAFLITDLSNRVYGKNGAKKIFSVDVGTNQLHEKLKEEKKIISIENCNAKYLNKLIIPDKVDLLVCDVSFISLKKVIFPSLKLLSSESEIVALIKPQFETQKANLKKGVVKDILIHKKIKGIIHVSANELEEMKDYQSKNIGKIIWIEANPKKYEYIREKIALYDEMILENQDDLWNIYYMRGICYERKDNWELAEKDFLKSLELQPGTPNVLNYLAYGWVERDIKLDRSLKMLEEAYKANPDSFYIIDSLAWAHFKKNNLSEAARLMEKVIDIAPGEAISLDHLGDIYYAMNRKREAIHFWQQALELAEPEDEITEDVQSKLDNINAG